MPGPFHVYMYGPGNGWWIGGTVLMVLFWAAVVTLIVAAVRHFGGYHHHEPPVGAVGQSAAMDTLKMRFARGEIDEDEYKRRAELLSGH